VATRHLKKRAHFSSYVFVVFGVLLLYFGTSRSVVMCFFGSVFLSAAMGLFYDLKTKLTRRQLYGYILAFFGIFFVSLVILWFNETLKRSCIPEGDCSERHEFNRFERLDNQIFGIYNNIPPSPY
jgi:Mn2+/Fe2+ NRAMP family transporter